MKRDLIIGKYTLESLTSGMYALPLDIYREYIQNAVDSFDEVVVSKTDKIENLVINVDIDRIHETITIHDNGCGIAAANARSTLLDIGNSRKNRSVSRGFRGIGRLAGLSYCRKLTFRTSCQGEEVATLVEFNAVRLKQLLLPSTQETVSVEDVIEKIVSVRTEKEQAKKRYFQVILEGVSSEAGLIDEEMVRSYLVQHAPIPFSKDFKWGKTVIEKLKIKGYNVSQYSIYINGKPLFKPYRDVLVSDKVKKNCDLIKDIKTKVFHRNDMVSAVLWYAETSFYGTILDDSVKGIRIRQGNILIGNKSSCNSLFKEERFNGWMIGELHIVDQEIIVNSRRDGFEKNAAYYDVLIQLKEWAFEISKKIRHLSYMRSLSSPKRVIVETEGIDDFPDVVDLYSEELVYDENYSESMTIDQDESSELAETDYISKLGLLLDQKKAQTKYAALNINSKLTVEQRKVLERVFDLITQEYEPDVADRFVNIISNKF